MNGSVALREGEGIQRRCDKEESNSSLLFKGHDEKTLDMGPGLEAEMLNTEEGDMHSIFCRCGGRCELSAVLE